MAFHYPSVRREPVTDRLFGRDIPDPYRWLEDPDSQETQEFVKAQNTLVQEYLSKCSFKSKFKESLTKLYNYPRYGCPMKKGDAYYYFHNTGLQPQAVLYKQTTLDGPSQVFLDPNTLSEDGTVSMGAYSFTKSGNFFAYSLSASGSDWKTIHVRTKEGVDVETPLKWAKFTGIEWTKDEKGYFYTRYPAPKVDQDKAGTETDVNRDAAVYYHFLGTDQSHDIKIYSPENPENSVQGVVTDDGDYLLLITNNGCRPENLLYVVDLKQPISSEMKMNKLINTFEAEYDYLANDGATFWFKTTKDAPRRKIIKINLDNGAVVQVVPEAEQVISSAMVIHHDKLLLTYLKDVKDVCLVYSLYTGQPIDGLKQLPLPVGSIISSMSGERSDDTLFYSFSSFTTPGEIQSFNFNTLEHKVLRVAQVPGYDSTLLETRQVFYPSKDGTKIPMFIISKKNVKLDANNVTLLYGYGGFNISITPSFSVTWINFILHMNGVVAVANIRGGGEYGESWYDAGRLKNKQNVFDDFQSAAKYLANEKYTRPEKLGIMGGSNGGLLVGACVNQAPELFGCGLAAVGVMDVVRFHKFTIGHAWTSDYGNPEVEEDFNVLIKYSPLHNVQTRKYPAILITTGDHDDRVVPLHSHKFLATLQHHNPNNPKPIMGRIETKAGHGAGKSIQQRIEESTDQYAFLGLATGAEWSD